MLSQLRQRLPAWPQGLTLGLALLCSAPLLAQTIDQITVNGQRTFDITAQTTFSLDGQSISASQAALIGSGFSAQVAVSSANGNATSGVANNVDFRNLVRGPITATDPLSVLDQPLTVTGETVLEGIPGNDLSNLAVNDLLDVSGFLDVDGIIVATRIALQTNPTADWKLFGQVSGLSGNLFNIGAQAVDFSGVSPVGCVPDLADGQFVELEALPNPGYSAGSVLGQLNQLECEDPNFTNPPPGTVVASLEGIISEIPDPMPVPAQFSMLGITVLTTAQTEYRAGTVDDLDLGVRVEAEGFYDSAAQTLTATEVRFVQAQVRFEAPVDPADVNPGDSIVIMGSSVAFTPQTRDEDGIVNGLSAPTQVEVRGLLDRDGTLFATRVRERGNPDLSDTRLRGPVSAINEPELEIFGITIDTAAAVFRDHQQQPLTAAEFFALVQVGMLVSAENSIYDPVTQTMVAGVIELEQEVVPAPLVPGRGAGVNALSRGTVTVFGTRDSVFSDTFE
ncbi:MAG: hypothetical protein KDI71_14380 [Xanthomonadales bacterium]|nr:hypothetical protein [Xanthomonadales bacterium]